MPKRLRLKAEKIVSNQHPSNAELSEHLHELRVHQVELEMQNEALQEAQVELGRMRQKYMDMFYEAPIAYMICDENGIILELNKRLSYLLGVNKSDLLGRPFARFAAESSLDTFFHHCKEVLKSNQQCSCEMVLNIHNLQVIIKSTPVASSAERHIRTAVIDISQQKELTQKLSITTQKAEAASQAKSDFLAMMSHELRTPLHGIMGLQNIVLKEADYLQAEHRKHLEMAQHSSHILHVLIDDLLDLSKIEAGKININPRHFDAQALIEQTMTIFSSQASAKGIALKLTYQNMPDIIKGDKNLIRQILLNLLGNAMKFTDKGYVRVVSSYEDGQLFIQVEDSGIGIDSDKITQLFDPFVQLSNDAARKGTGLGTTIAMRLARAMSGDIRVRSKLGQGSTFTLTLPMETAGESRLSQDVDLSNVVLGEPDTMPIPQVPSDLKILLAEDDDICRMIALRSFKRAKLNVDIAVHGSDAWEKIQRNDYDILLTDIRMPGMDGIDLTRRIRQREEQGQSHRTRIIGLSAHAMEEVMQECLEAGMDDFLSKPISTEHLLHCLA